MEIRMSERESKSELHPLPLPPSLDRRGGRLGGKLKFMISLAATKFMNEQFEADHKGCFEGGVGRSLLTPGTEGTCCGRVIYCLLPET